MYHRVAHCYFNGAYIILLLLYILFHFNTTAAAIHRERVVTNIDDTQPNINLTDRTLIHCLNKHN